MLVDTGDVTTDVSIPEVVSVADEDDTSMGSVEVDGVCRCKGSRGMGAGEAGGGGISRAFCLTLSGGRARGEMIIPGALDGSVGRLDQMTYSGD